MAGPTSDINYMYKYPTPTVFTSKVIGDSYQKVWLVNGSVFGSSSLNFSNGTFVRWLRDGRLVVAG